MNTTSEISQDALVLAKAEQEIRDDEIHGIGEEFSIVGSGHLIVNAINANTELQSIANKVIQNPFSSEGKLAFEELTTKGDLTIFRDLPNSQDEDDFSQDLTGLSRKQINRIGDINLVRLLIYEQSLHKNDYDKAVESLDIEAANAERIIEIEKRIERTKAIHSFLKETDKVDSPLWDKSPEEVFNMVIQQAFGTVDLLQTSKEVPSKEIARIRHIALNIADRFRNTKRFATEFSREDWIGNDGDEKESIDQKRLVQRLLMPLRYIDPKTGLEVKDESEIDRLGLIPTYQDIPGDVEVKITPYCIIIRTDKEASNIIDGNINSNLGSQKAYTFINNRYTNIIRINTDVDAENTLEHEKSHSYFELLNNFPKILSQHSFKDLLDVPVAYFEEEFNRYLEYSIEDLHTGLLNEITAQYIGGTDAYKIDFTSLGSAPSFLRLAKWLHSAGHKSFDPRLDSVRGNVKPKLKVLKNWQKKKIDEIIVDRLSAVSSNQRLTRYLIHRIMQEAQENGSPLEEVYGMLYSGLSFDELLSVSGFNIEDIESQEVSERSSFIKTKRHELQGRAKIEDNVSNEAVKAGEELVRHYLNFNKTIAAERDYLTFKVAGLLRRKNPQRIEPAYLKEFEDRFKDWSNEIQRKRNSGESITNNDLAALRKLIPRPQRNDRLLRTLHESISLQHRQVDFLIHEGAGQVWTETRKDFAQLVSYYDPKSIDIPLTLLSRVGSYNPIACCHMVKDIVIANPNLLTKDFCLKTRTILEGVLRNAHKIYSNKYVAGSMVKMITLILGLPQMQESYYQDRLEKLNEENQGDPKSLELLGGINMLYDGVQVFGIAYNPDNEFMYDWPSTPNLIKPQRSNGVITKVIPVPLNRPDRISAQVIRQEKGVIMNLSSSSKFIVKEHTEDGEVLTREYYIIDNEYGRGYVCNNIYYPFTVTQQGIDLMKDLSQKTKQSNIQIEN